MCDYILFLGIKIINKIEVCVCVCVCVCVRERERERESKSGHYLGYNAHV